MAQKEVKQWITVNGKHIPIFEGESKEDAVKRAVGKGGDKEAAEGLKESKEKNEHYDTKLNDIRDRLRNGHITPEQAKNEAFEYEKSQRGNKKWSDVDRNRMESKVRDIFDEADTRKSGTQNQNAKQLGDTLREKGSVGIKDANQYINMNGSELRVNYRDYAGNKSAYMTNTDDKNGEGITVRSKNIKDLEDHLKANGYTREKGSSEYEYVYRKKDGQTNTQKQISKDLDTKEKQIAQAKAETDALNGKTTSAKKPKKRNLKSFEDEADRLRETAIDYKLVKKSDLVLTLLKKYRKENNLSHSEWKILYDKYFSKYH